LTRRSDFYSLGGVLYTLVTGRPPFAAGSLVELMHKQCYTLPERPAMLVPDLPAELDDFICGLLDKNATRRPATAGAVLDELERIRGKLERKGERLDWPAKITPDTAEVVALPAALAGGTETEEPPSARPLMKRPLIVIPLFLLVLTALVVPFAWPSPSADELYAEAGPLLESQNPDDWQKAVEQYLDPLERKYPDRYAQEIAAARAKVKDRQELKRSLAEGAHVDPRSDAERAYLRGLRLAQAGDPDAARRLWQASITAFGEVKSESRWVELARVGLEALKQPEMRGKRAPPDRAAFDAALGRARELATTGKPAEAAQIYRALEELFHDDPALGEKIRHARDGK
jgi:tetratricopeptide (TPR) repeat protein